MLDRVPQGDIRRTQPRWSTGATITRRSSDQQTRDCRLHARHSASIRIIAYAYASRCESLLTSSIRIRAALEDCNKAIELEPKLAYAYRVARRIESRARASPRRPWPTPTKRSTICADRARRRCRAAAASYIALGQYANAVADCSGALRNQSRTSNRRSFIAGEPSIYRTTTRRLDRRLQRPLCGSIPATSDAYYWLAEAEFNSRVVCRRA